jgi:DNA helicase II / ATP-dependent DNA helicase PcrA
MIDFASQYNLLNKQQKKAVDTIEGPVIVIAGPGTGKTQILTLRIANILKKAGAGIGPENILALTFTNAGVIAMRERLVSFIGVEEAYKTNIFTFHSFCEEQINQYPEYFSEIAFSRVATDIEKIHILEEILLNNEFEFLATFGSDFHYVKDVLHAIDELKREGVHPKDFHMRIDIQEKEILASADSYYKRKTKKNKKGDLKTDAIKPVQKNRELHKIYSLYQKKLHQKRLYDFTDMIMQFIVIAENNDEFASALREKYQYILVDEHQDTNDGQNRVIDLLTDAEHLGGNPNLFTVGDDKQAIYRFQGASVENFLHFQKKFKDILVINLEDNYRSAQEILDHAHALISSGEGDKEHQDLTAYKKDPANICVKHFCEYKDELVHIADDIRAKIANGVNPGDIAVFYREHNNLPFVKEIFEKKGVPYVVTARQDILDDPDIQKLIIYLRVVFDPRNNNDLAKLLLCDFVDVDIDDTLAILEHFGHVSRKKRLYEFLKDEKTLVRYGVVETIKIRKLISFIREQKIASENTYFVEFFENFVRESGFLAHILSKNDHIFLLRKLSRLFDEVRDLVIDGKEYRLGDFVKHIETYVGYDLSMNVVRNTDVDGVNLMTAHGSKGLEFEHVYITNVVNGLWGNKRRVRKFQLPIPTFSGDIEDERRLFYVALTRAKSHLTLSYADYDMSGREKMPSQFISDLKDVHFIDIDTIKEDDRVFFAPRMRAITSLISHEYIRDRFLSTPLSPTALNNYFESPLLYFFRNLVRLPSVQNKTMLYGSVLHATLEKYFTTSHDCGEFLSKEELLNIFDTTLNMFGVPYEHYDSFKKRGRKTFDGYYDHYRDVFPLNVELEKKIRAVPFKLDSGEEILLTGIVDKIVHNDDKTVTVVDYKSGKPWSRNDTSKQKSLHRQVVFYKLLLDSYNDGQYKMSSGELDFIEPHPYTHEYEKKIIAVNEKDVLKIKREINDFATSVISGTFLDIPIEQKYKNKQLDEYVTLLAILKRASHTM